MTEHLRDLFSESDSERIAAAVRKIEQTTCGEIVPFVVDQSDPYIDALWRAAATAGAIALLVLAVAQFVLEFWMPLGVIGVALVAIVAGVVAALLVAFVPGVRRLVAGKATMTRRVAQRAAEAFIAEEIFATRERTGILIFLSLFEHQVLVLGDTGINAKVGAAAWTEIVRIIVDGIRADRPADGLVEAIGRCGDLLIQHGYAVVPDDVNELPDRLRFGDRR